MMKESTIENFQIQYAIAQQEAFFFDENLHPYDNWAFHQLRDNGEEKTCLKLAIEEQKTIIIKKLLEVSTLTKEQEVKLCSEYLKPILENWLQHKNVPKAKIFENLIEILIQSGVNPFLTDDFLSIFFQEVRLGAARVMITEAFKSPHFNIDMIAKLYVNRADLRANILEVLQARTGFADAYSHHSTFFLSLMRQAPKLAIEIIDKVDINFCGFSSTSPLAAAMISEDKNLISALEAKGAKCFSNKFSSLPDALKPFVNPKNFSHQSYDYRQLKAEILDNAEKQGKTQEIETILNDYIKQFEPQVKNIKVKEGTAVHCFSWMRKLAWCSNVSENNSPKSSVEGEGEISDDESEKFITIDVK